MDVILETKEDRFSTCKTKIAGLVLRLNLLKDVGHVAQQADMKEIVEASGAGECRSFKGAKGRAKTLRLSNCSPLRKF